MEPLLWLLFSTGGVVAALMFPVLVLLFGVAFPLGWLSPPDHAHLLAVVRHPLTRVVLFGSCLFALVHAVHRLRYALVDGLRLQRHARMISMISYGAAIGGSAVAAYVLLLTG